MFKHSTGWDLNARILRLVTDHAAHVCDIHLFWIVREEIAQDRALIWC